jgi:hypothetical protein
VELCYCFSLHNTVALFTSTVDKKLVTSMLRKTTHTDAQAKRFYMCDCISSANMCVLTIAFVRVLADAAIAVCAVPVALLHQPLSLHSSTSFRCTAAAMTACQVAVLQKALN